MFAWMPFSSSHRLERSQLEALKVLRDEHGDSFGEAYPSYLELLENARARV